MEKVILAQTLVARAGTVDFDALVLAHGRLLLNIAYAVLRNIEDAEDIVQETFIRAFRSGEADKVERMQSWLGHIAWRLAVNRLKKRSAEGEDVRFDDLIRTFPVQEPGAEELLLKREREALLERLLQSLPGDLRETFVLLTVEGMTSPVAAEVLGIAESSIRDRLLRARTLLKAKLSALMEHNHGA